MPELEIFYQPIISLETQAIAGVEALLRVDRLSPVSYLKGLAAAEMRTITDFVLSTALSQAAMWHSWNHHLWISVNLAGADLARPHLADYLAAHLAEANCPKWIAHFEIPESVELSPAIAEMLTKLIEAGYLIALDDCGERYSGLAEIADVPWSLVKVDRRLVPSHPKHRRRAAALRGITAISREIGFRVCAEGIEQPWQADLIAELGIEYGQGWYWGHAIPAAEFRATWL